MFLKKIKLYVTWHDIFSSYKMIRIQFWFNNSLDLKPLFNSDKPFHSSKFHWKIKVSKYETTAWPTKIAKFCAQVSNPDIIANIGVPV